MKIEIELDEKQTAKLQTWTEEVLKEGLEKQKHLQPNPSEFIKSVWETGRPYTGAISGQFTYLITHTSLGIVVKVKDSFTGKEIDLTNYEDW